LILDIDNFKSFNDKYGHQTGDVVLKKVAKIMSETLRKSDTIARYGGEEFVIVLPETNISGAQVVGEKVRKAIENCEIEYGEDATKALKVTVSVGGAEFNQGEDRMSLIERADKNLYKAKANGRNRLEI
jgi:diguanylate cyclase (GGDEF)-like protein